MEQSRIRGVPGYPPHTPTGSLLGGANRMVSRTRGRTSRGFTLIELLVVILVLAILMAVALPLYLAAVTNAQTRVCRSNMQTIANGEQAFRARDAAHQYTTDLTKLPIDLGQIPVCPTGGAGSYSVKIGDGTTPANNGVPVADGGLIVQCTQLEHGVFAPGVDSE